MLWIHQGYMAMLSLVYLEAVRIALVLDLGLGALTYVEAILGVRS